MGARESLLGVWLMMTSPWRKWSVLSVAMNWQVGGYLHEVLRDAGRLLLVVGEHADGGVHLGLQVGTAVDVLVHQLHITVPLGIVDLDGGPPGGALGLGDEGLAVHLEKEGGGEGDATQAVGSAHRVHRRILRLGQVDAEVGLGLGLRHVAAATGRQQEGK